MSMASLHSARHHLPSSSLPPIIWSAWLGPLPLPGYLAVSWRTVELANAGGATTRLVCDADLPQLLQDIHPAFPHLSYVHRADYARMALLHTYGGIWLDLETIAIRNFSHLFRDCSDDGVTVPSNQGAIGPLKPNTTMTRTWRALVHEKLDSLYSNLRAHPGGVCIGSRCEYALGWQAILGNIWTKMENEMAWVKRDRQPCIQTCNYGCPIACYNKAEPKCDGVDVAQGTNAGVSNGVKRMTYEQFIGAPGVLGQMMRASMRIPPNKDILHAIAEQRHCLTLAEERKFQNGSKFGSPTCPPPAHPLYESSTAWTVVGNEIH
ncbi:hypothetical protein AB1Y20_010401 [Prymnesium parvum]|uniref:Glycosyltransferase family 32 protein n=1 Tax=Prymnesium parvum TaxID=97485 RepID=A0AB34IPP1_PRYPA